MALDIIKKRYIENILWWGMVHACSTFIFTKYIVSYQGWNTQKHLSE